MEVLTKQMNVVREVRDSEGMSYTDTHLVIAS